MLLVLLASISLTACESSADDSGRIRAKRIILVTCDTLRADRLGLYGYERDTSPRLDAFARECIVFDEAYSSAPMTQPSISSLLAGRLPFEVGTVPGNVKLMPAEVETLAERLRAHGLSTAAFVSNWILRKPEPEQGDIGVQQGFDHFDDEMPSEGFRGKLRERIATDTTDAAIDWLTRRETDSFFLWVHYQDPHGPYTPPAEYAGLFRSPRGVEPLLRVGKTRLGMGEIPDYQALDGVYDPAVYRDLYDAEIRYFDTEFGRLVDWLRENELLDDSLFVFTADHGEALGEHDYWFCHGETVYREIVRVPLLIRWPGGVAPEQIAREGTDEIRRCLQLASHLDVMPTVLDALGLTDAGARGVSLLYEAPPTDRVLPQDLLPMQQQPIWRSASDGRFRLIRTDAFTHARLFDVSNDPGETTDLAQQHPEYVKELARRRAEFLENTEARQGADMFIDADDAATMDALGYTGDDDH